ncbi:hypothetical protein F7725_027138 [Dissostichus mawsoni]|uniref:Cell morphogenesis protein C-terminal domain-containing protein n=1 Tax=Dissostichus mawsoni TaxID=36200 RepID=A0A7J5XC47_DISMA|nr:hypothetical protein F7725_027138 [Dissostichus mawsoni]
MLHYLLPWMNNVELVDLKPTTRRAEEGGSAEEEEEERESMMVNSRRWLRGEGWGSPRATTMVLNNLMFMTAKYGDEFAWSEIENVKRVVVYLGRDKTMQLLEELMFELESTEPQHHGAQHEGHHDVKLKDPNMEESYTHLDIYSGLNSNLNRQHHAWSDSMPLYANWRLKVMDHNRPEPLPFPPPEAAGLLWCNIAVILLTDLIVDHGVKVEWNAYLHLLLHAIFIGFDHQHPEVYEHCKRLLLHLLVVQGANSSVQSVAMVLLRNRDYNAQSPHREAPPPDINLTGSAPLPHDGLRPQLLLHLLQPRGGGVTHLAPPLISEVDASAEQDEKVKALIEFITSRKRGPLWNHEDVSPKNPNIKSAEQLSFQLDSLLSECLCRRSLLLLQTLRRTIFRALKQPLTLGTLSDILSRLVETVGDPGEEAQGFVIELLLTLESGIDTLADTRGSFLHNRSNSLRASLMGEKKADRRRSNTLDVADRLANSHGNLARTRSLSGWGSRRNALPPVDPSNLMATVFWIAASLLESDYEFEYLLALRLLNTLWVLFLWSERTAGSAWRNVQNKLKWYSFPGLLQLFLKGFTSASTQELTIHLLSKLISVSRHTLVDPSQAAGFPLNILCLLPHLIQHLTARQRSVRNADKIAKCVEEKVSHPL